MTPREELPPVLPQPDPAAADPGTIPRAAGNLWQSLGQLGGSLLDYGKTRVGMVTDGIQHEVNDSLRSLVMTIAAMLLFTISLILAGIAVIVGFWDTPHRLLAAVLTAAGFLIAACALTAVIWHQTRKKTSLVRTGAQAALLITALRRFMR